MFCKRKIFAIHLRFTNRNLDGFRNFHGLAQTVVSKVSRKERKRCLNY